MQAAASAVQPAPAGTPPPLPPPDAPLAPLTGAAIRAVEERLAALGLAPGGDERWTWEPLAQGGSDREYFRARHAAGGSWVIMRYSGAREENALYAGIGGFLVSIGLNAPRILLHDAPARLAVIEDLGDTSLWNVVRDARREEETEPLYRAALEQAALLHRHGGAPVKMMDGFDAGLYRWERDYFFENLAGRRAGLRLSPAEREELDAEGERLAAGLLEPPPCLIHRDFQSQNLMVRDGAVWLIDFQGMRLGHAAYDVASLLCDPYVEISGAMRERLVRFYAERTGADAAEFGRRFCRAAVQRLMQALGAYGFLGLVRGKRAFLDHIPRGLENLAGTLERAGGMERTLALVRRIQIETARPV